jgi:hypothetical protein
MISLQDGHAGDGRAEPMSIEHCFECNCVVDTNHDAECYVSTDAASRKLPQQCRTDHERAARTKDE